MKTEDQRPLLGSVRSYHTTQTDQQLYKVYKRRWYVLAVFVMTSCTQVLWGYISFFAPSSCLDKNASASYLRKRVLLNSNFGGGDSFANITLAISSRCFLVLMLSLGALNSNNYHIDVHVIGLAHTK